MKRAMTARRRAGVRGVLTVAAAVTFLVAAAVPVMATPHPFGVGDWAMGGHDPLDSRSNPTEHVLNPRDVNQLAVKWTYKAHGDVSATPAVVGGAIYFTDWGGYLSKVDARTGKLIWDKPISGYNNLPGSISRTSPTVVGNIVYVGDPNAQNFGVTSHLFAIDATTGNLVWSSQLDAHPLSIVTQSPMVYRGVVYIGVASKEEVAATLPTYPCCTFRGSVVALDQATGKILWKTYLVPANGNVPGGYSGNGVWGGTPAIDPIHHQVLVTTGNNYTVPASVTACQNAGGTADQCLAPDDYQDSVVALDLTTGKVKWAAGQKIFDQWTAGCSPGFPPNNCPPNPGQDYDFGDGAHIYFAPQRGGPPRELVGAGQKSGTYWSMDAGTGKVVWSSAFGPGGVHGGVEWGSAIDGPRIYFADANTNHVPFTLPNGQATDRGFYGALDGATGKLLWETVDPSHGEDPGAISAANGVAYAGSMSGHMFALDGRTGAILWDYQGIGSSNAGPAIAHGALYWGNGYNNRFFPGGTGSSTVYAFSLSGH